jgi:hypothetical protein
VISTPVFTHVLAQQLAASLFFLLARHSVGHATGRGAMIDAVLKTVFPLNPMTSLHQASEVQKAAMAGGESVK